MKLDRKYFYIQYRKLIGKLSQSQVDHLNEILDMAEEIYPFENEAQFAYTLATIYHETAHTFKPLREFGRGRGHRYGRAVGPYKKKYYGRGYVQLTWMTNYKKQGQKLKLPLQKDPDLVMIPDVAWKICALGMIDGDFTGHTLSDHISGNKQDFYRARKIVNGMDRASLISKHAKKFLAMIKEKEISVEKKPTGDLWNSFLVWWHSD